MAWRRQTASVIAEVPFPGRCFRVTWRRCSSPLSIYIINRRRRTDHGDNDASSGEPESKRGENGRSSSSCRRLRLDELFCCCRTGTRDLLRKRYFAALTLTLPRFAPATLAALPSTRAAPLARVLLNDFVSARRSAFLRRARASYVYLCLAVSHNSKYSAAYIKHQTSIRL